MSEGDGGCRRGTEGVGRDGECRRGTEGDVEGWRRTEGSEEGRRAPERDGGCRRRTEGAGEGRWMQGMDGGFWRGTEGAEEGRRVPESYGRCRRGTEQWRLVGFKVPEAQIREREVKDNNFSSNPKIESRYR